MKLWATNEVRAKSKFWYFLRKLKKVKKSNGQVLAINEVFNLTCSSIWNPPLVLDVSELGQLSYVNETRDTGKDPSFGHVLPALCPLIFAGSDLFPVLESMLDRIFEKSPTKIKNYGIWLRYQSRTGYHNMYKEYRDTTLNGAVEQMYTEMASRHRVRFPCIQIIKTATIPAKLCKRDSTKQFHNSKIKFPLVFKKVRPPTRKLKTTYKATKPNLFM
ncbi:hypothetical protein Gohar_015767 [Gossypium harknessii]|uniref:Large ribosomal subunit protein eL20 domain-containing protein n=1 Tax=Gossypium harknessii TaxID=34285 RepID=A0A7J9G0T2_9ROSI|nr:hypothetical protein [Gossypium harknessii]